VKDAAAYGTCSDRTAIYKGLAVTVYSFDMIDLPLARQDIIDLVEVSSHFIIYWCFTFCNM